MTKLAANRSSSGLPASPPPVEFYRNATLDLAEEVARHSNTSPEKREELWASMREDVRRLADALVARRPR